MIGDSDRVLDGGEQSGASGLEAPGSTALESTKRACGAQPWPRLDWILLIGLALAAVVAFVAGLGSFGILDPSDGYYSEGAREMFLSGNWLTPQLNYAWFFDKPILNYWMIAGCYRLFGVGEFASRLPAAICGAALVPALFAFCRQFCRRRASLFAALALLSSPMWLILGHMSLTDMPLSFFTWIALFSFYVALEKKQPNIVWIAYISMGCGLLTKGPVALFLVAMNLGLYVLLGRPSIADIWTLVKRLQVIPGLILTFAIAAPWYLMVNAETHGVFVQEFFLNQNINRAMGTVDHKAGPLYYIPVVLGAAFPWTLFLLISVKTWCRPWLRYVKRRPASQRTRVTAFGVTVVGAIFLFFSALPTKLVTYVLPMLPGLAILTGLTFDQMMRRPGGQKALTMAVSALVCLVGAAGVAVISIALFAPPDVLTHLTDLKHGGTLVSTLQQFVHSGDVSIKYVLMLSLLILSGAGAALFSLTALNKARTALLCFVALTVISVVVTVPSAIVLSYQQKCRDMQQLVLYAKEKQIDPVMLGHRTPSAMFYIGRKINFLAGPEDLITLLKAMSAGKPVYFLVHRSIYSDMGRAGQNLSVVREGGDWILGRKK